jgi:hypothetical protein
MGVRCARAHAGGRASDQSRGPSRRRCCRVLGGAKPAAFSAQRLVNAMQGKCAESAPNAAAAAAPARARAPPRCRSWRRRCRRCCRRRPPQSARGWLKGWPAWWGWGCGWGVEGCKQWLRAASSHSPVAGAGADAASRRLRPARPGAPRHPPLAQPLQLRGREVGGLHEAGVVLEERGEVHDLVRVRALTSGRAAGGWVGGCWGGGGVGPVPSVEALAVPSPASLHHGNAAESPAGPRARGPRRT